VRPGQTKVVLLSCVEEFIAAPHGAPLAPPVVPLDTEDRVADARKGLEAWKQKHGIDAEVVVLTSNDIAKAVTDYAEGRKADLLVLATHGRTGFRHLVLGSVAEAILRHADLPILVFPRPRAGRKSPRAGHSAARGRCTCAGRGPRCLLPRRGRLLGYPPRPSEPRNRIDRCRPSASPRWTSSHPTSPTGRRSGT
jgi:nucleotide-binding universal stress UspA family protein